MFVKKRGLSSIVSTVLIVLLAMAAIAMTWVLVSSILNKAAGPGAAKNFKTQQDVDSVKFVFVDGTVDLQNVTNDIRFTLKRDAGGGNISGFIVMINDNDSKQATMFNYANYPLEIYRTMNAELLRGDSGSIKGHGLGSGDSDIRPYTQIRRIEIYAVANGSNNEFIISKNPNAVYSISDPQQYAVLRNIIVNTPKKDGGGGGDGGDRGGGGCSASTDCTQQCKLGPSCTSGSCGYSGNAIDGSDCNGGTHYCLSGNCYIKPDCTTNSQCVVSSNPCLSGTCNSANKCAYLPKVDNTPCTLNSKNGVCTSGSCITYECTTNADCTSPSTCNMGTHKCELAPIELTSCGTLNQAGRTYKFSNDIIDVSPLVTPCFNIVGNDIIIDGNGKNLIGPSMAGTANAIYSEKHRGITIKNLNIINFQDGIILNDINISSIINNKFVNVQGTEGARSLNLFMSRNLNISGNVIIGSDSAISLTNSPNNNISNNFINNNTGGISLYTFRSFDNLFTYSIGNNIHNNIISNSTISGITVYDTSTDNHIFDNYILNNSVYGIDISPDSIEGTTLINNDDKGIKNNLGGINPPAKNYGLYIVFEENTFVQCNYNGICSGEETIEYCPDDCAATAPLTIGGGSGTVGLPINYVITSSAGTVLTTGSIPITQTSAQLLHIPLGYTFSATCSGCSGWEFSGLESEVLGTVTGTNTATITLANYNGGACSSLEYCPGNNNGFYPLL